MTAPGLTILHETTAAIVNDTSAGKPQMIPQLENAIIGAVSGNQLM